MTRMGFAVALSLAIVASAAASELKWEQLPADPGSMHPVGSMLDLVGPITGLAADDFLSDEGSVITAVEWWGVRIPGSCGPPEYFTIRFFDDVPGPPFSYPDDPPIYTVVSDSFVEAWDEEYEQYRYYQQLTIPFYPEVGTVYWISIQGAVTDATTCAWYWCDSLDYWNDEAVWKSDYEHVNWYSPDWTPFSVHTGGVGEQYYVELAFRLFSQPASAPEGSTEEFSWGSIKALFK